MYYKEISDYTSTLVLYIFQEKTHTGQGTFDYFMVGVQKNMPRRNTKRIASQIAKFLLEFPGAGGVSSAG